MKMMHGPINIRCGCVLTLQAIVWWQACLVAFVCHGLGTLDLDVHTLISFSYVTDVSKLSAIYLREIRYADCARKRILIFIDFLLVCS